DPSHPLWRIGKQSVRQPVHRQLSPMSDQSKPSRWTRVAAYLICLRNNAVLLTQLTKSKQWTFPGGGLEHGEDPYDGVLRELTEETGYSGVIDRLVGIDSATWTYDQGDGPT